MDPVLPRCLASRRLRTASQAGCPKRAGPVRLRRESGERSIWRAARRAIDRGPQGFLSWLSDKYLQGTILIQLAAIADLLQHARVLPVVSPHHLTDNGRQTDSQSPYMVHPARNVLSERHSHPPAESARPIGQDTVMLTTNLGSPLDNALLSGLPRSEFDALLLPHFTTQSMPQGRLVLEAGDEFDHVWFPHNGMISLLVVLSDGKSIEIATVGREGVVGAMSGLGLYRSLVRAVIQLPMVASRIPSAQFRKIAAQSNAIREMCIRYNEVLLSQARITAACNALHPVEARFCRWLLQSADRANGDTVALTQEFLAEMLGVRRTSVTEVASKLQAAGFISYSRGVIKIIDRAGLEAVACECYRTLIDQSAIINDFHATP
jgi:CRP-like cAMP-binding protein